MAFHTYSWPTDEPRDPRFSLHVEGQAVLVWATRIAAYAIYEADGPHAIAVSTPTGLSDGAVRPWRHGIEATVLEGLLTATVPGPGTYLVDVPGAAKLHLFVHPLGTEDASAPTGEVIRFEPGKVHEAGALRLEQGQHLVIPGGAIVRGCVHGHGLDGVSISGRGVLDMQQEAWDGRRHMLQMDGCRNVVIRDVTLVRPHSWMMVMGGCDDVRVTGVREIGEVIGSDGLDLVGCRRVRVSDCGFRNNDDCVVIKSLVPSHHAGEVVGTWNRDVDNVVVERCVFWNDNGGNAIEIGHELRTPVVGNITFRDIDILHVGGVGAPLSIHAGDRASVQDILFEDIRIEHHYQAFLDFRVMRSMWNRDDERGHIRRVTLRRVVAKAGNFNWGYSISTIGGWDAEHRVEDLVFEDVVYGDLRLTRLDDIEIFTRHLGRVDFVNSITVPISAP